MPPLSSEPKPTTSGDPVAQWKRFLADVWKRPSVASHLERARLKSANNGEWVIGFSDKFAMDSAQRAMAFVQETLTAINGAPVRVRFTLEEADRREGGSTIRAPQAAVPSEVAEVLEDDVLAAPVSEAVLQDPALKQVLGVFKGRVRSVEGE